MVRVLGFVCCRSLACVACVGALLGELQLGAQPERTGNWRRRGGARERERSREERSGVRTNRERAMRELACLRSLACPRVRRCVPLCLFRRSCARVCLLQCGAVCQTDVFKLPHASHLGFERASEETSRSRAEERTDAGAPILRRWRASSRSPHVDVSSA